MSITPVLFMAFLGYYNGITMINKGYFQGLNVIRDSKKELIESYFENIENSLIHLSEYSNTINAIKDFKKAISYIKLENDEEYKKAEKNLHYYYKTNFLPRLNEKLEKNKNIYDFLPKDSATVILQNSYILNKKSKINQLYDIYNNKYDKIFKNFFELFDCRDIFLIDAKDLRIIYNVYKETDFARSLKSAIFFNKNIREVCKKINSNPERNSFFISDLKRYEFSFMEPSFFIGSSVFDENELIGMIVFQISMKKINQLISSKNENSEDIEISILGEDFKIRANNKYIEDQDLYLEKLEKTNYSNKIINNIKKYKSNVLIQKIENENLKKFLSSEERNKIIKNDFISYSNIKIGELNWKIIVELEEEKTYGYFFKVRIFITIITIILIIIIYYFSIIFVRKLVKPIIQLKENFILLSEGKFSNKKIEIKYNDEIGETINALNELSNGLKLSVDFANKIGEGKLDTEYIVSKDGDFGNALLRMRDKLKIAKKYEEKNNEEKRIQKWINDGINGINKITHNKYKNLNLLSKNILYFIINYLDANQGGFFVINDEINKKKFIEMTACVAYKSDRREKKKMSLEEGLVGRCIYEKEIIYIKDLPKSYLKITSGLGDENPKNLIIVPLILNGEVFGVIEIASFKLFKKWEMEFMKKISEDLASSVFGVKSYQRTEILLKQTKTQSEELIMQEEELRQNLEELQTSQEMSVKKTKEMQDILSVIDNSIMMVEFDKNSKFISLTNAVEKFLRINKSDVLNKKHQEISNLNDLEFGKLWNKLKKGEIVERNFYFDYLDKYVRDIYTPVFDENDKLEKVILIYFDITEETKLKMKN